MPEWLARIDVHKYSKDTFIIYGSTGLVSISDPVDGIVQKDDQWHRNIPYGVQLTVFGGRTAGTTYNFKLFSFFYSKGLINYKVDGNVPKCIIYTILLPLL